MHRIGILRSLHLHVFNARQLAEAMEDWRDSVLVRLSLSLMLLAVSSTAGCSGSVTPASAKLVISNCAASVYEPVFRQIALDLQSIGFEERLLNPGLDAENFGIKAWSYGPPAGADETRRHVVVVTLTVHFARANVYREDGVPVEMLARANDALVTGARKVAGRCNVELSGLRRASEAFDGR